MLRKPISAPKCLNTNRDGRPRPLCGNGRLLAGRSVAESSAKIDSYSGSGPRAREGYRPPPRRGGSFGFMKPPRPLQLCGTGNLNMVEWIRRCLQMLLRKVQIDRRVREIRMTEQHLNRAN